MTAECPTLDQMTGIFADPSVLSVQVSVELGQCDRRVIRDRGELLTAVDLLVEEVDMQTYGNPLLCHFGEGPLAGNTAIRLITTSNVTAHGWDDPVALTLTLDSCKPYDVQAVLDFLIKTFGAGTYDFHVRPRRIPTRKVPA
jgi:S-adenosylmethionine/arginine decarboxylase-like enzyme